MTLPQMRLVKAAYHNGSYQAGATAMNGYALFHNGDNAQTFAEVMLGQQWFVGLVPMNGGKVIKVTWTCERSPNGHVTPIRSESHV